IGGRLRRAPDPIAAVVALALTVATAATGLIIPALAIESAGFLILFPVLMTLILPWSTAVHVRWLAGWAVIAIGFLVIAPSGVLRPGARGELSVVRLVVLAANR